MFNLSSVFSDYSYNHIKDNIIRQLDQKLIEVSDINVDNLDQFITDGDVMVEFFTDDCGLIWSDEIYLTILDDLEHEYPPLSQLSTNHPSPLI